MLKLKLDKNKINPKAILILYDAVKTIIPNSLIITPVDNWKYNPDNNNELTATYNINNTDFTVDTTAKLIPTNENNKFYIKEFIITSKHPLIKQMIDEHGNNNFHVSPLNEHYIMVKNEMDIPKNNKPITPAATLSTPFYNPNPFLDMFNDHNITTEYDHITKLTISDIDSMLVFHDNVNNKITEAYIDLIIKFKQENLGNIQYIAAQDYTKIPNYYNRTTIDPILKENNYTLFYDRELNNIFFAISKPGYDNMIAQDIPIPEQIRFNFNTELALMEMFILKYDLY